ncbi:hypothetical protein V6N11_011586 [Hibiscus sabdariffa]|uniref:Uncharacterized protein n=1 Tax=Hibiscus sabdariffa TaxID=183260 RepID=A0ABR2S9D7_9ROSI
MLWKFRDHRQLPEKAPRYKESSWNHNSDSTPTAEKRSGSGESVGESSLGNSVCNKLVGSENISLENNNLDGGKSNSQIGKDLPRGNGEKILHGKEKKSSWAAIVAKSGPELPLGSGGSQLQIDKELDVDLIASS